MAEIQPYRYGQLPSAAVGTPGVDRAAGQAFATGAQGQYQLAQEQLQTQAQRGAITNQLVNTVATGLAGVMQMRKQQARAQQQNDAALHVAKYKAISDGEVADLRDHEETFDKPDNWQTWYENRMTSRRSDFLNNIPDAKTRQMVARQIPGIEYSDKYRLEGEARTAKTKLQEVGLNDLVSNTKIRAGNVSSLQDVDRINQEFNTPELERTMFRVWGGKWGNNVNEAKKNNLMSYFTTTAYKDPQRAETEMNLPALADKLTADDRTKIKNKIDDRQNELTRDARTAENNREIAAKSSGTDLMLDFESNWDTGKINQPGYNETARMNNLALIQATSNKLDELITAEKSRGNKANLDVLNSYKSAKKELISKKEKVIRNDEVEDRRAIHDAAAAQRATAAATNRASAQAARDAAEGRRVQNEAIKLEREKFNKQLQDEKNALATTSKVADLDAELRSIERVTKKTLGTTGRLPASKKHEVSERLKGAQAIYDNLLRAGATLTRGEVIEYKSRIKHLEDVSGKSDDPQSRVNFIKKSEMIDSYNKQIDAMFPSIKGIPGRSPMALNVRREFGSTVNFSIDNWQKVNGRELTPDEQAKVYAAVYNKLQHKYKGAH